MSDDVDSRAGCTSPFGSIREPAASFCAQSEVQAGSLVSWSNTESYMAVGADV